MNLKRLILFIVCFVGQFLPHTVTTEIFFIAEKILCSNLISTYDRFFLEFNGRWRSDRASLVELVK